MFQAKKGSTSLVGILWATISVNIDVLVAFMAIK